MSQDREGQRGAPSQAPGQSRTLKVRSPPGQRPHHSMSVIHSTDTFQSCSSWTSPQEPGDGIGQSVQGRTVPLGWMERRWGAVREAPLSPAARVEEGWWAMDPAASPGLHFHPALGSTVLQEP